MIFGTFLIRKKKLFLDSRTGSHTDVPLGGPHWEKVKSFLLQNAGNIASGMAMKYFGLDPQTLQ